MATDDNQYRDKRVPLLFTERELEELDEWRHRERIHTRSDAIREALRRAYRAADRVKQKKATK